MGEMAGYFLDEVCDEESLREDYALGFMSHEDAYDHNFINEMGYEQNGIQDAYDRIKLNDRSGLDDELNSTMLMLDIGIPSTTTTHSQERHSSERQSSGFSYDRLSEEAIENLFKEHPTCNICRKEMGKRTGKFGAFYFCSCKGQGTVSESYWNSVKIG